MPKVKLTVVKLPAHEDLIDKYINKERYPDGFGPCALWKLGQEFLIEDWPARPDDSRATGRGRTSSETLPW